MSEERHIKELIDDFNDLDEDIRKNQLIYTDANDKYNFLVLAYPEDREGYTTDEDALREWLEEHYNIK